MSNLYYTPPSTEIFNEVREKAMELWPEIDSDNDKFGYATSKINRIKDVPNVHNNLMFMVAMFDIGNQAKLASKLSEEARTAIRDRMIDGGNPAEYIVF